MITFIAGRTGTTGAEPGRLLKRIAVSPALRSTLDFHRRVAA
jgi:hypothetical protein